MKASGVLREDIPVVWPVVEEYIQSALAWSPGTYTPESIFECLLDGTMQLWMSETAATVTEVVNYPAGRRLRIFLAGGTLEGLMPFLEWVYEWGKEAQGCDRAEVYGRPGWQRILPPDWKTMRVVMEKEL